MELIRSCRAVGAGIAVRYVAGSAGAGQLVTPIWEVEPITSMSDDEVSAAVGPTIQRYIDGDIAPARKRTRRSSAGTSSAVP